MNSLFQKFFSLLILMFLIAIQLIYSQESNLGIFEAQGDIGKVGIPGSVKYDPDNETYTITGGGTNMWFTGDEFHFVWKKASGDISIAANITWPDTLGNPHKKACLIIRQSLDTNSAYADAAFHGVGLTSLQYRERKGDVTREIQSNVNAPTRLKIEKEGDYVFMSVAKGDEPLHPAGGSFRIKFSEPFYIGLGVCAHDNSISETAIFSNVKITSIKQETNRSPKLESTLETINIESKDRRVIYTAEKHFEAPNWSKDGKYFLFNSEGHIFKLPVTGGEPQEINTGFAVKCNNDHGISPDGTQLAISDQSETGSSIIYILPIDGGTPEKITKNSPSYWHGWSPDGKTLAFCGERNGEFDIYTIPAEGGKETRLTTSEGLDDGPDYSPDGKYIYFNSTRTGTMQIWRMKPDGSEQVQITSDEYNNWFAHPSPDSKWIVFLSYEKDIKGHPPNKDVMLRIMPAGGGEIQVLAKLFGGQGTINVPSWSPDSQNLAFVSYRLVNQ